MNVLREIILLCGEIWLLSVSHAVEPIGTCAGPLPLLGHLETQRGSQVRLVDTSGKVALEELTPPVMD